MLGGLLSRGLGRGVGFSKLDLGRQRIGSERRRVRRSARRRSAHADDPALHGDAARRGQARARGAPCAYAAGKRIVVYKLGRSEVGQDLAASHTGAMAGSDEMADAFFRAHRIVRVDTLENLFELPALLRGQKPSKRHRVAVMTTTGGGAASVVDRLGTLGVEVVGPTPTRSFQRSRRRTSASAGAAHRPHARRREERDLQRGARTPCSRRTTAISCSRSPVARPSSSHRSRSNR